MSKPYSTLAGTVYGVALNDRLELTAMADAFRAPPHGAPPSAPVLYIKPRNCLGYGGAAVRAPGDVPSIQAAATIGVLFARDVTRAKAADVGDAIGGACLALDVREAGSTFFRPQVRQQCRDGFLPLGAFAALPRAMAEIVTEIDGRVVHRWGADRLHRSLEALVVEISAFMTFQAGDLLLLGVAGDAPVLTSEADITVRSEGLPPLTTSVRWEAPR